MPTSELPTLWRLRLSGVVVCALWTAIANAEETAAVVPVGPPRQPLLSAGDFPGSQWIFYPGKQETRLEETWTLEASGDGPILVCRGEPHGYLRTSTMYQEFEFGLQWKYPQDVNGNSGVLIFTDGEDKIWPTAVQVQLHQPRTGSVFGSGGARVVPELESRNLSRPVNQWNELLVTSRRGDVQITINGKSVGEVRVVAPRAGAIGLQSEGSEVHFRKIWIRDLQPIAQSADAGARMSQCGPLYRPVHRRQAQFSPTFGSGLAYSEQWSVPLSRAQRRFAIATGDQNDAADGIPLAGDPGMLDCGGGAGFAGGAAWQLEVSTGRRGVHSGRRGRGRH